MIESPPAAGHHHRDAKHVQCAILTISDSRTLDDDPSGDLIARLLHQAGHKVVLRAAVRDDVGAIRRAVLGALEDADVEVLITTGGTGVSPRDVTPYALEPLFRKRIPGFGEIFRQLSFQAIGAKAILSDATAGVIGHSAVFALPGSVDACKTAIEKLVVPTLGHVAGLLRR